jgi:predicted Zn-dependent protease
MRVGSENPQERTKVRALPTRSLITDYCLLITSLLLAGCATGPAGRHVDFSNYEAVVGAASDPETAGAKFIERMRTRARVEPVSTRKGPLGEFPAFVVTYLDRSGRAPAYLHFAWVAMGGKTYQLIGLAPEMHRETLKNAALSLRPLTDVERSTVTGKRLRIVAARQGERLENLSARTGNSWSPAYTALANALDVEAALREGQLIKIARTEPTRPGSLITDH